MPEPTRALLVLVLVLVLVAGCSDDVATDEAKLRGCLIYQQESLGRDAAEATRECEERPL